MSRKILHKALRISRGLALATGALVICTVVLGAATTALAAAPGDPFRLGQINSINKFTKLVGAGPAPRLILDNNGTGPALRLLVEPGKPPMQVNSARKVARLNADKVDGKDADAFLPASIYRKEIRTDGSGSTNETVRVNFYCDAGDTLLSGGYRKTLNNTNILGSYAISHTNSSTVDGWQVSWVNEATIRQVDISIVCADTNL